MAKTNGDSAQQFRVKRYLTLCQMSQVQLSIQIAYYNLLSKNLHVTVSRGRPGIECKLHSSLLILPSLQISIIVYTCNYSIH